MTVTEFLPRPLRRIVSPIVPAPLLTDNTYDQAESGYYNVGYLTTSRNSARTQEFDSSPDGAAQRTILSDAAGSHTVYNALTYNQTAYKLYYPGGLSIGDNASRCKIGDSYRITARLAPTRAASEPRCPTTRPAACCGGASSRQLSPPRC